MADGSNIRKTLKDVHQAVEGLPNADEGQKNELKKLIFGLRDILTRMPADRADEADMVAEQAKVLVESASLPRLNRTLVGASANGLIEAAERLDDVAPRVLAISQQITGIIR
ncbi:MAG: hypothetical protein QF578_12340 [Alphaproteobacteria bacterium]|jgi:hypothetical protein|nr:hypothetical protein [Alphaproteobacteria bacterium]MDP6565608.1 hypothetical protein [Alphaproteobacteria bacterium]MDP6814678.1 hypothetical protein [Alphaproteobacteria bacterium]